MKIAFIINVFRESDFHSGGERYFYELLNRAIKEGYIVDLYCSKYLPDPDKKELQGINKLTILGESYYYKYPDVVEKLYTEIKNHLDKENYDFVLAENITPPVGMALLQGHSAIHYKKMQTNLFDKVLYAVKKRKHLKYQREWFKRGYKKIFAVSNILKNEFITNFNIPEDKFSVIYPGIDLPENIAEIDYNNLIDRKRELIFGISAPSFRNKGGFIFLKALNIIKNKGYKFKARIIYPKARKNLAVMLQVKLFGLEKFIEFLPYQSNMGNFYNSIDCLVMPSILETFGLVALEATSHKRISIVSSYSGASEIINDGKNGFVFDISKNAAKNLAEKMAYILDNPNKFQEISNNSYETAKIYTWSKTCDEFIAELSK